MEQIGEELPLREFLVFANPEDDFRYASIWVSRGGRSFEIRLPEGLEYKQVYGVAKKLCAEENPEEIIFEGYEIEGVFDAENIEWKTGRMKIRNLKTLEEEIIKVENFPFSLFVGDKLYHGEKKIFSL